MSRRSKEITSGEFHPFPTPGLVEIVSGHASIAKGQLQLVSLELTVPAVPHEVPQVQGNSGPLTPFHALPGKGILEDPIKQTSGDLQSPNPGAGVFNPRIPIGG